jgi:molybdate transport system regulatory protein
MPPLRRRSTRSGSTRSGSTLAVKGDLWLDRGGKRFLGERRIALLESIDALGSIVRAAKAVGLSYKGAWDALDAIENVAEERVVVRATGGRSGGGSRLTDHGRALVRLYRDLESGHRRVLSQLEAEHRDAARLQDLLRAITMKTSARNQLRGKVVSIRRGAVNADVALDLGAGIEIVANITLDAVDELGLERGRDAVALIKASFVMLAVGGNIAVSTRNRLPARVKSVARGPVNSEVKLELADTRTLVAVTSSEGLKALGLREGDSVFALINASHVLIAVND